MSRLIAGKKTLQLAALERVPCRIEKLTKRDTP